MDLTPQAETLLRFMADEEPSIDVAGAADRSGLSFSRTTLAMRELVDGGLAKEHVGRLSGVVEPGGLFDITPSGRRTASRLY